MELKIKYNYKDPEDETSVDNEDGNIPW